MQSTTNATPEPALVPGGGAVSVEELVAGYKGLLTAQFSESSHDTDVKHCPVCFNNVGESRRCENAQCEIAQAYSLLARIEYFGIAPAAVPPADDKPGYAEMRLYMEYLADSNKYYDLEGDDLAAMMDKWQEQILIHNPELKFNPWSYDTRTTFRVMEWRLKENAVAAALAGATQEGKS